MSKLGESLSRKPKPEVLYEDSNARAMNDFVSSHMEKLGFNKQDLTYQPVLKITIDRSPEGRSKRVVIGNAGDTVID